MTNTEKIVVTGAAGQLGTEIVSELRNRYGTDAVIATDIRSDIPEALQDGPYSALDASDAKAMSAFFLKEKPSQIYHLAALLSARAEELPNVAWAVNVDGYKAVLDFAKEQSFINKIYFPSSIAVFGPNTPKRDTPQHTIADPTTLYGISKLLGEQLSQYYFAKHKVDVRSLRYPGIISYKTLPGGGTTDYAIDIFHHAVQGKKYNCFLKSDTALPMMYISDALKATFDLMEAPASQVQYRGGYNIHGITFTPQELADAIKQEVENFEIEYNPDFRQGIADSWPASINDTLAKEHWGWKPEVDLPTMTHEMITHVASLYNQSKKPVTCG